MYYQVVARPSLRAGAWDYYPYWAPTRDRDAATRLAKYAGQTGHEAAILQSRTLPILRSVAFGVIERQDARLLPPIRYALGARLSAAGDLDSIDEEPAADPLERTDPYQESPTKAALDARRLDLELGTGGDSTQRPDSRSEQIAFPGRWDVLRVWLSVRRRFLAGEIGSAADGAHDELPGA